MRKFGFVAHSALMVGVALLGTGAVGVAAAIPSDSAEVQSTTPRDDRSRRVCRSLQPTGSRLAIRRCRPQSEWDEEAEQARRGVADGARASDRVQPGTTGDGPR